MADSTPDTLLLALSHHGMPVRSACDLFNLRLDYAHVIPVLVGAMDYVTDTGHRLCVIRALANRQSDNRAALGVLCREFESAPPTDAPQSYRWTVANSIDALAAPAIEDWLCVTANDPGYGLDRVPLVAALARLTSPRSLDCLGRCLEAQDVRLVALKALLRRRKFPAQSTALIHELSQSGDDKERKAAGALLRTAGPG